MGAQASTNKVKTTVEINNEAINKCGSTTVTNAILLKKAKITCPKDCKGNCKFSINQGAAVDATCLIQAHQDALSETMAAMDAKTKAGLGFGASTNVSDMKKQISNKIQSECGGASSTQKVDASEMQLEMCDVTFAQNATLKSKCELGALQALRDKTETVAKATTEGFDPSAFINAYANMIMGIVGIIVIVIAVVAYSMMGGGGGGGASASAALAQPVAAAAGGGGGAYDLQNAAAGAASAAFEKYGGQAALQNAAQKYGGTAMNALKGMTGFGRYRRGRF